MLVIVMENQLLSPEAVCNNCPMASQNGLPRWQKGRLRCARPVKHSTGSGDREVNEVIDSPSELTSPKACTQYECAMGFHIAELSEQSA